jgi:hypothetical protein
MPRSINLVRVNDRREARVTEIASVPEWGGRPPSNADDQLVELILQSPHLLMRSAAQSEFLRPSDPDVVLEFATHQRGVADRVRYVELYRLLRDQRSHWIEVTNTDTIPPPNLPIPRAPKEGSES